MKLSSPRLGILTAALAVFSVISCSENLDSSGVCAVLCPPVGGAVQNVTLDAVVLDTTVEAFSGLGSERVLLLASRGDTLDSRVVIRFDSIPGKYTQPGDTAKNITTVDSAYIQFQLDTLSIKGVQAVTIEAYDVDTTANDTSSAAILVLFRPDRFISSQTFVRSELRDTLKYFISNAAVLAKAQNNLPLRIGLRATGSESAQLRFLSTESGIGPLLYFRVSPDTAIAKVAVSPHSRTPASDPIAASSLADYTLIAKSPPLGSIAEINVGGFPARRTYIRFDIPASIIDSSTVVRATLLLDQIPNPALDPTDTVLVLPQLVVAGKAITDPTKAAQVLAEISLDTLRVVPGGAGPREVELARAFAIWRSQKAEDTPRALVLRSVSEGNSPLEIRFYSAEATAALRPRLRISYTSRVPLGLP